MNPTSGASGGNRQRGIRQPAQNRCHIEAGPLAVIRRRSAPYSRTVRLIDEYGEPLSRDMLCGEEICCASCCIRPEAQPSDGLRYDLHGGIHDQSFGHFRHDVQEVQLPSRSCREGIRIPNHCIIASVQGIRRDNPAASSTWPGSGACLRNAHQTTHGRNDSGSSEFRPSRAQLGNDGLSGQRRRVYPSSYWVTVSATGPQTATQRIWQSGRAAIRT
jgi:hypothetical protein